MDVNDKFAQQEDDTPQDVFQRRLGMPPAAEGAPETAANAYLAYGLAIEGRDEEGLTFYHADGMITVKFYAHLTNANQQPAICHGLINGMLAHM